MTINRVHFLAVRSLFFFRVCVRLNSWSLWFQSARKEMKSFDRDRHKQILDEICTRTKTKHVDVNFHCNRQHFATQDKKTTKWKKKITEQSDSDKFIRHWVVCCLLRLPLFLSCASPVFQCVLFVYDILCYGLFVSPLIYAEQNNVTANMIVWSLHTLLRIICCILYTDGIKWCIVLRSSAQIDNCAFANHNY